MTKGSLREPEGAGRDCPGCEALSREADALRRQERLAVGYIRDKTNQLLSIMGTAPLKHEELDDATLLELDPIGIVGKSFSQILSHLKETNRQLKSARDEIRAIFDSAGAGILVLDGSMKVIGYNRKQKEFFSLVESEALGENCCRVMCRGNRPSDNCTFDLVLLEDDTVHQADWHCSGRHYDVVGTPLHSESGQIVRVVLVYTDITEQKRIEAELRESELRYRDLFESAHDLIFILDRAGKIQYVNRSWCETLGYSPEEAVRMPFEAVCTRGSAAKCLSLFHRVLEGEEMQAIEAVFVSRDGRQVTVEGGATCRVSGGVPESVRGIFRDITRRKRAEEELLLANESLARRNEELKKLDAMKDGLIRDVSHELKTPVVKHTMQLEILRELLASNRLTDRERRAFHVMEESIRRQESVIRNLLDLSRLESGGRVYRRGRVLLSSLLSQVVEDAKHTIEAYGAEVRVDVPPVGVLSDEEMLWHVFSNLINNALKFRRKDVPLRVAVTCLADGESVTVSVTDNGIGMDPAEREKVFDRFYQASSAVEGSGVGLAICRRIVLDLGGSIWVETEGRNRGVTVKVTLPLGGEGPAEA